MKRILVLSLYYVLCLANSKYSIAQTPGNTFNQMSSLPLQAPQAASLSKYAEYPVSYYNGLATISLPIYTIQYADISVPISLNYHGGGIKVNEEASWVGLGWTLDAGGVISHDIKGGDDEYGWNHPFHQVFWDNSNTSYNPMSMARSGTPGNGLYNNSGASYSNSSLYSLVMPDPDGEPDMYIYNFGGYSGKFFSGIGAYVDMGRNNIKFQGGSGGFTAITPDGYTYTFDVIEKAWSYPVTHATNTAYHLAKITSPRGKVVNFQYKSFRQMIDYQDQIGQSWRNQYPSEINTVYPWGNDNTVVQLPALSEHFTRIQFQGGYANGESEQVGLHQIYSSTTSSNYYLDKIVFDNGYIEFVKSPRSDMYGVKLAAIKIYQSNGVLIKSIPFSYDYFTSTRQDDDMYNRTSKVIHLENSDARVDYYPASFRNKRLKLLNVSIEPQPHTFQYMESDYNMLPYKTSFAQDFWGYFNGRNNPSQIPDYNLYSQQMSLPSQLSDWHGANREVDNNYIRAGMLSRINYPTGGYSEFAFEPNQFDNLSPQQQNSYTLATYGGVDGGAGIQKFYFTITADTYCDLNGGLYCNGMLDMNSTSYNCGCLSCSGDVNNTLYANIEKVDPNTHALIQHYPAWDFQLTNQTVRDAGGNISMPSQLFTPGTYCITVNYPDNHNPPGNIPNNRRAELYVQFYQLVSGQSNTVSLGGGLRIGSIKHYDPDTRQTLLRKYIYSGGKIMRYPVFYSSAQNIRRYIVFAGPAQDGYYMHYYLYSTPAYPYSFSANGSSIGYNNVTETITGSTELGKTIYTYQNTPDIVNMQPFIYLPGVPSAAYLDNGFLKNISFYDKDNTLLKESINNQSIGIANTYWAFKGRYTLDNMNGGGYSIADFSYNYLFSFYPIQVGKLLTLKTTQKDYANSTVLTTIKDFTYNSNGLLKSEILTSSNGDAVATNYSYANDYTGVTSGWIKDLKDKNFVGIPLEVLSTRNSLVTGGNFTSYTVNGNIITPNQVYTMEVAAPANISSSAPSGTLPSQFKLAGTLSYDNYGNLTQAWENNNIYTSYLWGYNKAFPIAKVIGSAYATISGYVNQTVLDNPFSTDNDIRTELNKIRTGLASAKAMVTTFTYRPVVGMTSQTDANNVTTYYVHDEKGRLAFIKDKDGNIIKKFCYNFMGQVNNSCSIYGNTPKSGTYTKNCTSGSGTQVTYAVSANKYYASTQLDADALAQSDVNANGQAYANANGTCTAPQVTVNGQSYINTPYIVSFYNTATGQTYNMFLYPYSSSSVSVPIGNYNVSFNAFSGSIYTYFVVNGYSNYGTSATFNNVSINSGSYARIGY